MHRSNAMTLLTAAVVLLALAGDSDDLYVLGLIRTTPNTEPAASPAAANP